MWIEIEHINRLEGDDGHFFKRYPCIEIEVGVPALGQSAATTFTNEFALIDTGADHVYVDRALMQQRGATVISTAPVNNTHSGDVYNATIKKVPFLSPSTIQVCGIDLVGWGAPYRVVLGRQFLSAFRLEYEPARHHYRLLPLGAGTPQ